MLVVVVIWVLQGPQPESSQKQQKAKVEKGPKENIPAKNQSKITRLKLKNNKRYVEVGGVWLSLDQVLCALCLFDCLCRHSIIILWSNCYLIHGEGILWTTVLWI